MARVWVILARAVGRCCCVRDGTTASVYGCSVHTTNNKMELTAVIEGLRALKQPCRATIVTDSEYVRQGITEWIHGWKRNGWKTRDRQPVKNKELWIALEEGVANHEVRWQWVKGHADHPDNNRADKLAAEAAKLQITTKS